MIKVVVAVDAVESKAGGGIGPFAVIAVVGSESAVVVVEGVVVVAVAAADP